MLFLSAVLDLLIRIAIWGGILLLFVLWLLELVTGLRQAKLERNLVHWWAESTRPVVRRETPARGQQPIRMRPSSAEITRRPD